MYKSNYNYEEFDSIEKRPYHKIRPSYFYAAKHLNDRYKNLGYDYNGKILINGTSPELWANPQQHGIIMRLEGMILYLLESSKLIKKWFSIAHDKNTTIIN